MLLEKGVSSLLQDTIDRNCLREPTAASLSGEFDAKPSGMKLVSEQEVRKREACMASRELSIPVGFIHGLNVPGGHYGDLCALKVSVLFTLTSARVRNLSRDPSTVKHSTGYKRPASLSQCSERQVDGSACRRAASEVNVATALKCQCFSSNIA